MIKTSMSVAERRKNASNEKHEPCCILREFFSTKGNVSERTANKWRQIVPLPHPKFEIQVRRARRKFYCIRELKEWMAKCIADGLTDNNHKAAIGIKNSTLVQRTYKNQSPK